MAKHNGRGGWDLAVGRKEEWVTNEHKTESEVKIDWRKGSNTHPYQSGQLKRGSDKKRPKRNLFLLREPTKCGRKHPYF